jgi:hypothetical protein
VQIAAGQPLTQWGSTTMVELTGLLFQPTKPCLMVMGSSHVKEDSSRLLQLIVHAIL